MLHVVKVEGNVKGLRGEIALGPKTLIVGPNGAGKSRVMNAVELALSGYASDVTGRPAVKAGADLIALAPPDEPLHARVTLSDGRAAAFRVERKAGGTAKPAHAPIAGLTVAYPATEALAALRGSVAAARTFVLRHAGAGATLEQIQASLPGTVGPLFAAITEALPGEPVDRLLAAREQAAKRLRAARAEVKALETQPIAAYVPGAYEAAQAEVEAATEALAGLAAPVSGPSDAEAAARAQEAGRVATEARRRALMAVYAANNARAALDAARSRAKDAERRALTAIGNANDKLAEIEALDAALAATQAPPTPETDLGPYRHALGLLAGMLAGRAEWCWACGASVDAAGLAHNHAELSRVLAEYDATAEAARLWTEGHATRTAWVAEYEALAAAAEAVLAEHAAESAAESAAEAAHDAARQAVLDAEAQAVAAEAIATESVRAAIAGGAAPVLDGGALEAARERLRLAQAAAQTAAIARAGAQAGEATRAKLAELRAETGDLEHLDRAIADAIEDLVRAAAGAFVARVQSYLPETDKFALRLQDGKSEVCDFGLDRDGTLHTALSGAEWARLLLALGAATTPIGPDVLAILAPEERAFDPATLAAVMRGLSDAPAQVLLTSPVKPRGKLPRGWTLIDLSGDAAEGGDRG